ncbi:coiled-coil domain-containing protein 73 isoform X3 [Etheostoma spectabile]|uniref:coiled-coil domain-containing protein 73 isoform X3 n=1 Tax=Etheostoma spectabile TaxID=54343 RepID=UPI0013AE9C10|nr:coiled-coil domain-containing protein 73 isoform X3 [Etheostoma spectabile]
MDLSADSGTLPNHTTVGGPVLEQELSLPNAQCQAESGGTILLQLLEFKTHLLEAVEELHIRRDAETRFEDQISKLVLEKQELDWEKESLQHQIETVANQHTETLINVKKQLQAKIRNIEEEKGKYQVSAELKEKEINNLKEELKMLQLLKYNLEKKSSELEQKLALQNRSKDSHLNQLGEVEKRFSAVSRQCAMVKQAHEKLEQNVDEAMKINKKLTTVNEKQEATIVSLKKELEEVSNKLIKAKMSSVRHDKAHSPTGSEQHFQQLQQKLNMETEMNKKLGNENLAVRAEKQAVMKCLQHTQQLLLSQTQTVSKVELELQTQREQYQALKQEHHRVMREKNKAMEEKIAQLMENYAASKNRWDNEKSVFLDCIKSEQQDLQAVKEAYNKLHQGHTELSSQAKVQAQHIYELKGSPMSEQNNSGSGGLLRHPASTIPMFLKSKHNKVPLVISRASDLLNASSVCGTAASIRRQQGEWKALGETFRETATADMESSASVSVTSFPVSTSITVSRLSWPTTPGCSRAPTSTVGPGSESDWEPSCSQEREDEQSSFRAHISKIEQFLNTERLRLPKRQKTEN